MGQINNDDKLKNKGSNSVKTAFQFENKKEAVMDSKNAVDAVLKSPIDLAFLSKPDGTIVAINQSGAEILHQQSDQLVGIRIFELLSPNEAMDKKKVFEKVIKTGKSTSIEGQIAGKWFRQNIHPVFDLQENVRQLAFFSYDITDQKKTELLLEEKERQLKIQAVRLDELNTTLKILLKKKEQDKNEMEHNLLANVKYLFEPFIEKIKDTELDDRQKYLLEIIDLNIKEIVSPLTRKLSMQNLALTSNEIRIANLIKHGRSSKEISKILNISPKTVYTHRKNIRKKIGVDRKKANLRSYLLSMESHLTSRGIKTMPRILIIEDDIQLQEMLQQMLTHEGYEVQVASNGIEGIRCYHKTPADLVITDIIMPEKSGIETISELKETYPEVTIIAMSGGGRADIKLLEIAETLGAQRTLNKPFPREELIGTIKEVLKESSQKFYLPQTK